MELTNQDGITMKGQLNIKLFDEAGNIKEDRIHQNLVVTAGKYVIADRMKGTPAKAAMSHMSVGTSSTAAAVGDSTLGAEIASSRVALSSTAVSNNVITYTASFGAGVGTGAVVESGIFNAASAGDMLCRTTFSVVNKGANDTMTVTWTVTIS